ncbi:MAG: bifunctional UDP-sugar hydrolase/5'-nucleotidase [Candidatus Eremiobacteraeota bacterium]|nr:bifunctional UDP-sugar hydrolase/5'-nucleotidase [Candidatus Eremiobacteraeota bacterium]
MTGISGDYSHQNYGVQGHHGDRKMHGKRHEPQAERSQSYDDSVTISKGKEPSYSREAYEAASPSNGQEKPSSGSGGTIKISIINTHDMHGYFKNMANIAGLINQLREQNPGAMVVDGGDVCYNPPYSDRNHYEPMPDVMNQIGYNLVSLGNHEFQWNKEDLDQEFVKKLNCDVLCANVLDPQTKQYLPGVQPYLIKDMNGVKVGFIGVVEPRMATSAHPNVGHDVLKLDPGATLKKLIPEVKAKGADVIVVLSHQGIDDDPSMAKQVSGIDVILASHDHQITQSPITVGKFPNQTYIVESGSHCKNVGLTTIEYDPKSKEVVDVEFTPFPASSHTVKADPAVQEILNGHRDSGGGSYQDGQNYHKKGKRHH